MRTFVGEEEKKRTQTGLNQSMLSLCINTMALTWIRGLVMMFPLRSLSSGQNNQIPNPAWCPFNRCRQLFFI